jgi:hypothetical protein
MSSSTRRNLHGRGRMVVGFKLPMQSVPITTNIVSSNRVHGEVYSIQHYVIKFVSDLLQDGGTLVSSTNKTDRHDITELLLKVALNTIKQTNKQTVHKVKIWYCISPKIWYCISLKNYCNVYDQKYFFCLIDWC